MTTDTTPAETTAETQPPKCRAVKHGRVDLHCTLDAGHDKPQGDAPATWHEASYTDHQEIDYDGAHHTVHVAEHVTWEPVDPAAEAMRHLFAGRDRDA